MSLGTRIIVGLRDSGVPGEARVPDIQVILEAGVMCDS